MERLQQMAIHKLREGPVTMRVSGAEVTEGQYGTQVKFTGATADDDNAVLYISERSAITQLERIALTVDQCAGEELYFEHVHKDGRTYTNVRRVTDANRAATTSSAPATKATPSVPKQSVNELYGSCLSEAMKYCEGLAEHGWAVSASDVIAMTATIFIQASRR